MNSYLLLIWKGIVHRKLRTFLTVLGVIIGVTAIVSLIMVSQGLENSIKDQFSKMGSNRLFMSMKGNTGPIQSGLTEDDVDVARSMPYFKWITPYLIETWPIEYAKQRKTVMITAMPVDNIEQRWADMDISVQKGRVFQDNDKYAVIIGKRIANDLFDKKVAVNSNILINGLSFKVIGIFNEFGNPQDDSNVFIPLITAHEILGNNNKAVTMVDLSLSPGVNANEAASSLEKELRKKRGLKVGEEDFMVSTPDQLLAQLNTVLSIVQTVLVAIALISLVVGSIGIMNSMYTSVLERTKDIGVMRAVGAGSSDILKLFLIESFIIGIIGGVIGAGFGILISKTFEAAAAQYGYSMFHVNIDWIWILGAVAFAGLIGAFAGYLPAKEASKLEPAEALR